MRLRREFPQVVVVNVLNRCNFRCPQCAYPTAIPARTAMMTREVFDAIVEELSGHYGCTIRFMGLSEATLHPELTAFIKRARGSSVATHLLSNGSFLLRSSAATALLVEPPDVLEIGLDAYYPSEFKVVRGKSEALFRKLEGALEAFAEAFARQREIIGQPYAECRLGVSFVAHEENRGSAEKFRERWGPVVDFVRIRQPHTFNGRALGMTSQKRRKGLGTVGTVGPCGFLRNRIFVDHDGAIHACTLDDGNHFTLGFVSGLSAIRGAWLGAERRSLERALRSGVGVHAQCAACERCPDLG